MEFYLIVASFVVSVAAFFIAWRRPESLKNEYDNKVEALRKFYEGALEKLRKKVDALEQESDALRLRYWEAVGRVNWLEQVLRQNKIEIPPVPEYFKPRVDAHGNISIMITEQGGVQVSGGRVAVGHNLAGGNTDEPPGNEKG